MQTLVKHATLVGVRGSSQPLVSLVLWAVLTRIILLTIVRLIAVVIFIRIDHPEGEKIVSRVLAGQATTTPSEHGSGFHFQNLAVNFLLR